MALEGRKKTRMRMVLTSSHATAVTRMPASSGLAKGEVGFGGSLVPRQVDATVIFGRPRTVLRRLGLGLTVSPLSATGLHEASGCPCAYCCTPVAVPVPEGYLTTCYRCRNMGRSG